MLKTVETLFGFTENVVVGDPITPEQSKKQELKKHDKERKAHAYAQEKVNPPLQRLLEGKEAIVGFAKHPNTGC